jgi:hypothetical protein
MATSSQIEANPRNARKSTGRRTEEGTDRLRFHAVMHGKNASVPTPVVFQPVEPLAPTRLDAKSTTKSPASAKFEIPQNEPNLVNISIVANTCEIRNPAKRTQFGSRLVARSGTGMIVVSDTSPLNYLILIGDLHRANRLARMRVLTTCLPVRIGSTPLERSEDLKRG